MKQIFSYETKSASGQRFLEMQENGELFGEEPDEITEPDYEDVYENEDEEDYESSMSIPVKVADIYGVKSMIDPILEKYGFDSFADDKGIHIPRAGMMGPILVGEIKATVEQFGLSIEDSSLSA